MGIIVEKIESVEQGGHKMPTLFKVYSLEDADGANGSSVQIKKLVKTTDKEGLIADINRFQGKANYLAEILEEITKSE